MISSDFLLEFLFLRPFSFVMLVTLNVQYMHDSNKTIGIAVYFMVYMYYFTLGLKIFVKPPHKENPALLLFIKEDSSVSESLKSCFHGAVRFSSDQ